MSRPFETIVMELEQEGQATRRLLERVPGDKLGWRPHPRSMTLGQLALHVASMPREIVALFDPPEFDLAGADFRPRQPGSTAELLAELDNALGDMRKGLMAYDDARAAATWTLKKAGQVVLQAPRAALFRTLLCNHLYHHRGQLTVYLRLLDVPLPSVYGPTADENPFA